MKKRIALILLGLILATALFAATSTRFTKYGNIFKSGEFLLKSTTYELDSRGAKVGNPSPVTVAEHAGSYYMEATENGETFKVLIKDGKMNMISDADKSIMVMSMDDMDDSDTIDMPETVDVLSSGNDKLDGKTYYYEKAKAPDGTVSTYWYNGNDLYAIQSVDSIMYINSLTQKPDASLFEVPSGYEVMDMSALFSMFGDMGTDDYSSSSGDDYDWEAALAGIDWSALLGDSSSWDSDYSSDDSWWDDDEDDTPAEDSCDACPYGGRCGNEHGTMVLVARPGGDNTVMTMDELAEEIGGIFSGRPGTYDMHPVPGTEDLYYTIPEKKPLKRGGKTFYKAPAVVFGIDEDAGEVVSPNARQLYAAARYFENASGTIKTREGGETAVFCFD